MDKTDVALLLIRVVVGVTMVLHGLNHWRGGGKIAGTAGWFESLGLRPGRVHAWMSVLTEVAAGVGLAVGLLTPLACGAVVGVMVVAGVIEHRTHGFFVFKNGFEYVLMIAVTCLALSISGPGSASVDNAVGLDLDGLAGLVIAAVLGLGGAALLLGVAWRPNAAAPKPASAASGSPEPVDRSF